MDKIRRYPQQQNLRINLKNRVEKNDMGFVIFDRNIKVGKSIKRYSVGVMINAESSLEAYRLAMTRLFDDIQPLDKVPNLQGSSKQTAPLKLLFDSVKLRQTIIKHQFLKKKISEISNAKND